MLFSITYLVVLLVPGLLITRLLNISKQQLLFSVSFSLAYFLALLLISIFLNLSVTSFFVFYCIGFAGLLIFSRISNTATIKIDIPVLVGLLSVLIITYLYMSIVGVYDELPSDVYVHLEFFKQVSNQLQTNQFKTESGVDLLSQANYYWYHLPTLISYIWQTEFLAHLNAYTLINVMILLGCVYEFTVWIFNAQIKNKQQLVITALLSTLFFSLHFGINVFAYIRYYAIAPTILNYCVYLSSIVCLIGYYQGHYKFTKFSVISGVLFLTAFALHAQESLFIIIIYCAVSAILFINKVYARIFKTNDHSELVFNDSVLLIFPVMALTITVIYFYVTQNLELTQIRSTKVIALNKLIGYGDGLFILNPYKQFYTVVTHWGLFIILLYLVVYRRLFKDQPVLLAAMLIPLITVFNPFFNDLFLRISSSNVLWRFLYMLPLYIVAARIVTGLCFESRQSVVKMITNYFLAAMVFLLLLPINTSSIHLPYSRIYSLSEVHYQARPGYWQDMLKFLQAMPVEESIISDPVTGYMISALTKHHNRRHKFYHNRMIDPYEFDDYSSHPLKQYNGKIFVLNQRKGMSTAIAKIAQHWYPDHLKFTEFYSQSLIDHIHAEPEHFELLWQADQIKIYRINY